MKYNPFMPGSIVIPGMFVGRGEELRQLEQGLFQTKNGNPWHFLIHGERGIGKSSLLLLVDYLACGHIPIAAGGDEKFGFIVVHVEIGEATTYEEILRKIGADFAKKVRNIENVKRATTDAWNVLKKWEIMGVKFKDQPPVADPSAVCEDLCATISEACGRLKGAIDGVVILVDETDNACEQAQLGSFVKLLSERMIKLGCGNVCLGLSGITDVIEILRQSHPSSVRALNHIHLKPLRTAERLEVINSGIRAANEKLRNEYLARKPVNGDSDTGDSLIQVTITPEAADWIGTYSEGFPHFIQQYASSAFDTDNDNVIDLKDVSYGAFKENGALDQLGASYFQEMYQAINSDDYRQVLHVMAESPDRFVSRQHLLQKTTLKKTILGNALQALKNKKIILPHPEKQGLYRLPSDSFAVWIKAQMNCEKSSNKKSFM